MITLFFSLIALADLDPPPSSPDRLRSIEQRLEIIDKKLDALLLTQGEPKKPALKIPDPISYDLITPNEDAIDPFRRAMVFYTGHKYPEAILAFSGFMKKFPDHALAGSAQYFIAAAYDAQAQTRLALEEYSKLISVYSQSPYVSDSLLAQARLFEALHMPDEAIKARSQLSTLFTHSPAAQK